MPAARTISSLHVATFSDVVAATPAAQINARLDLDRDLDGVLNLVIIAFSELVKAPMCSIEEFFHRENARSKRLSVLGKNLTGQAVANQARLNFAMDVFFCDWSRRHKVETASEAPVLPLEDVIWQADLVCIPQFFTPDIAHLARECQRALTSSKRIFLAWQLMPPVERAIAYLGTHYVERVRLDDLATVSGVSKFHLVRLFGRTLGTTPHRYQTLLRVAHAKTMLRSGDEISDVAFRVGFFDQSHFCRNFRLVAGMTPSEYQRLG